jgi:RNA-splicing ligase RtcB
VAKIFDSAIGRAFGLSESDIVVSIHCGSRGLGHQIGTEFLTRMVAAAPQYGIELPDRELACAPIGSPIGEAYLGAMRAAINCALANRQILTHTVRTAFAEVFPGIKLPLLYDVSHNTCKIEEHLVKGKMMRLFVHRKGATRAFGPGHPAITENLKKTGQPVLIGGHGHRLVYFIRHNTGYGARFRFGLSRRRKEHEPASSASPVAREVHRSAACRARHSHSQPVHARRGGRSTRRLQRCDPSR